MLVFIDESGDSGLELASGSSRFFTIALVAFEDHDQAIACDQRIGLLRKELGWSPDSEFHFHRNSRSVRQKFLQAVVPYEFFYYGIVLNKDRERLWGRGFLDKDSFYKYTCSLVFENAKEKLDNATVVLDQSGNLDFRTQLASYLRKKMNIGGRTVVRKVKMQRSSSNNLLQLADYVAGAINSSMKGSAHDQNRRTIALREIYVQVWPKIKTPDPIP